MSQPRLCQAPAAPTMSNGNASRRDEPRHAARQVHLRLTPDQIKRALVDKQTKLP